MARAAGDLNGCPAPRRLVRQHPPLAVELLRHVGAFALPDEVTADLGSEDMTDVTPRANGQDGRKQKPQKYTADSVVVVSGPASGERLLAVVVEPQGEWKDEKAVSWPVYATTARKANKCSRAVVITVCWNRAEADGCRKMIATGHPGLVFIPIVISANNAPRLDGASPYLTLFNTIIGAVDLDTADGRETAITAITKAGANHADHRTLCDIILGIASDAAYKPLGDLMAISYRSKFIDGWIEQGIEQGKAIGEASGEARAEARTRADDILRVLKSRDLHPTRAQRELIETCTHLARLDTWFDRSLTAPTVDELFDEDEDEDED